MPDYMMLMHDDAMSPPTGEMWASYLAKLRTAGIFDGGSSIGAGDAYRQGVAAGPVSNHVAGYIRVRAAGSAEARALLTGNPVFECGGTVEIRELPAE
ncbi:MAG: hypothetical protein ACOH12_13120 [Parvibaculaceae bacterium]